MTHQKSASKELLKAKTVVLFVLTWIYAHQLHMPFQYWKKICLKQT
jgi:hypothetical protein